MIYSRLSQLNRTFAQSIIAKMDNKDYNRIKVALVEQKKLRENGSPKATIETDDSRSYFLIDIPARKDFVQDADRIKESDIERIKLNMSKICL